MLKNKPLRADLYLVAKGFYDSRAQAQAAILAGLVKVNNVPLVKPSQMIPEGAEIEAHSPHDYVSRGGMKLAAALEHFGFNVTSRICLDIGASTGGFTDVLLRNGAAKVYAVDVGHGQLHPKLQNDPHVVNLEKTDIRKTDRSHIPNPVSCIVSDISFISLKLVLEHALTFADKHVLLILLVKPQFEAGRQNVKKGIVRDPEIHRQVCQSMAEFVENLDFKVLGIVPSPITGGDGNTEFLLGAIRE